MPLSRRRRSSARPSARVGRPPRPPNSAAGFGGSPRGILLQTVARLLGHCRIPGDYLARPRPFPTRSAGTPSAHEKPAPDSTRVLPEDNSQVGLSGLPPPEPNRHAEAAQQRPDDESSGFGCDLRHSERYDLIARQICAVKTEPIAVKVVINPVLRINVDVCAGFRQKRQSIYCNDWIDIGT